MPKPIKITFLSNEKLLFLEFDSNEEAKLSAEFLRVHSPSAEVQGHHPDQAILVTGKENVSIDHIESVGNYAIKIFFNDGHDTGIFTWDYLYYLSENYDILWREYLAKIKKD